MTIWYRMMCFFGQHVRAPRKQVWFDGANFRSKCRGCGKPMVKGMDGWGLATGPALEPGQF